jgi:SsrA-binding protein
LGGRPTGNKDGKASEVQPVATNRKARFRYELLDRFEAGLELRGSEVKSLRQGAAQISEAYGKVRGGEVWVEGMRIDPYAMGGYANHEPGRLRRLLLHRAEIRRITQAVERRGLTLVVTRLYFRGNRAKIEVALARGKGGADRRQDLRRREAQREVGEHLRKRP